MDFEKANPIRRARAWKGYVERALFQHAVRLEQLETALTNTNSAHETLASEHGRLASEHGRLASEHGRLASEHDRLKSAATAMYSMVVSQLEQDSNWFGKNER